MKNEEKNEMCTVFCRNVFHDINSKVVGCVTVADYNDEEGIRCIRVEIVNRGFTFNYKKKDIESYLVYGGSNADFSKMILDKYRKFVDNRFFKNGSRKPYKKRNYIPKDENE